MGFPRLQGEGNKQIKPTRRQYAVLLFRAEQAHRKPAVLVAVVRARAVRIEVRVPSVGTAVLRARPVVTALASVAERTRTGHGGGVNISGGREDTGDNLGRMRSPPRILFDIINDCGSPGLAQVNAVDFQSGSKVVVVGKTLHTGVTVSATHIFIFSLGKLRQRRTVVRITSSRLEAESVTNTVARRKISVEISLLDTAELASLVDGLIGRKIGR